MSEQQVPEFVKNDPKLEHALAEVRASKPEAAKFALDPVKYLKDKGVDTRGLKVGIPDTELSDAELERVAGGQQLEEALSICASVGCVLCITAGS
jgi:hypothetical protein